ncbi:kunitz-type serine protease inhibitor DrTI-like [Lotus japonicus]|uniref:Uncharacterized protein n=1 Tax=Lotus japonicus TaxID=34305 RepID=I3SLI3_LOTJA|nr:kunitz-type serine protease inhibitor DrTI-like [Lotus japonicus]AFK41125.1 unknown [Lotus japonicus]
MTTSSSLLNLFFLLLTFTIKLKFAIAGGTVKDIDGNVLNITSKYSIFPSIENHGGVTVAKTGVKNQLLVVLSSSALPVTFTDSNSTKAILTDDIVLVNFTNIPKYNGSSSWIVIYDKSAKVPYVAVGSAKDYPSHQIKTGTFKIESIGALYKFVFCSDIANTSCKDVGVYQENGGIKRLALTGDALLIKFKKDSI